MAFSPRLPAVRADRARAVDEAGPRLAAGRDRVGFGVVPVLGDQRGGIPREVAVTEIGIVAARDIDPVGQAEHLAGPDRRRRGFEPRIGGGLERLARAPHGRPGGIEVGGGHVHRALVGLDREGGQVDGLLGREQRGIGVGDAAGIVAIDPRDVAGLTAEFQGEAVYLGRGGGFLGLAVLEDELEGRDLPDRQRPARGLPVGGLGAQAARARESQQAGEGKGQAHAGYQSLAGWAFFGWGSLFSII